VEGIEPRHGGDGGRGEENRGLECMMEVMDNGTFLELAFILSIQQVTAQAYNPQEPHASPGAETPIKTTAYKSSQAT
jgi:hypothetical protein